MHWLNHLMYLSILPLAEDVNIFGKADLPLWLRDLADNDQECRVFAKASAEKALRGETLVLLVIPAWAVSVFRNHEGANRKRTQLEELELLMDVSNILVGSFLNGLGEQSEVRFFSSPVLRLDNISRLILSLKYQWLV